MSNISLQHIGSHSYFLPAVNEQDKASGSPRFTWKKQHPDSDFVCKQSGKIAHTIKLVEKRLATEKNMSDIELREYHAQLTALKHKALAHLDLKKTFFKNWKRKNIETLFNKTLRTIEDKQSELFTDSEQKLKKLLDAQSAEEIETACAAFTDDDVFFMNKQGQTALHLLVLKGKLLKEEKRKELFEALLAKGANPLAQDQFGKTPLHYATEHYATENREGLEIAQLLVGNIQENGLTSEFPISTYTHENPFHFLATKNLTEEEFKKWYDLLKPILDTHPKNNPFIEKNQEGLSPIHLLFTHFDNEHLGMIETLFDPFSEHPLLSKEELTSAFEKNGSFISLALNALVNKSITPEAKERITHSLYLIVLSHPEVMTFHDVNGKTPFQYARKLLDEGHQLPPEVFYYCDPENQKVINYEKKPLNEWISGMKKSINDNGKRLGGDFNSFAKDNLQAFAKLLQFNKPPVIHYNAELTTKNAERVTPIFEALQNANVDFFNTLQPSPDLKDPVQRGPDGESLLEYALTQISKNNQINKFKKISIRLLELCPDLCFQETSSHETLSKFAKKLKIFPKFLTILNEAGHTKFKYEMDETYKKRVRESDEGKFLQKFMEDLAKKPAQ